MNAVPNDRRAVVIGAGIVGLCNAAYLQRDGWNVTLIDPRPPGEACSFGNCGMRSDGAALPIATPGILKHVPGMIMDPMGPLTWRWRLGSG
jgi:D-amino-acid dehydrogenase